MDLQRLEGPPLEKILRLLRSFFETELDAGQQVFVQFYREKFATL
jgi:hypothetical protein